jgi:hypothetical protein
MIGMQQLLLLLLMDGRGVTEGALMAPTVGSEGVDDS